MTTVLQVELLVEDNNGEHYYLVASDLDSVNLRPVVGEFIHTSKIKLEVTLEEGADFTREEIGDSDDD